MTTQVALYIMLCPWNLGFHAIRTTDQSWPKPSCKAQWKGEEDKTDRGRGGKTIPGNGQAWSLPSPREQWRTGENGGNWLQNHLWCTNDPRGYGIDEMRWETDRSYLSDFKPLALRVTQLLSAHYKSRLCRAGHFLHHSFGRVGTGVQFDVGLVRATILQLKGHVTNALRERFSLTQTTDTLLETTYFCKPSSWCRQAVQGHG